jgi:pteridine reductase
LEAFLPVALVTGAARRVGASIATILHTNGYDVIIHYHQSQQEALCLVHHLNTIRPHSALGLSADLGVEEEISNLCNQASAWKNKLSILVNNASLFIKDDALNQTSSTWVSLFQVNVRAPYLLSEHLKSWLSQAEGSIINITDIHADKPLREYGLYCQSKAALNCQTKALAKEFAPSVRVNAIAPGAIAWPEAENHLSAAIKKKIIAQTLLKAHGKPEYIAQAVLALAENPFITGQILSVDGGRNLR